MTSKQIRNSRNQLASLQAQYQADSSQGLQEQIDQTQGRLQDLLSRRLARNKSKVANRREEAKAQGKSDCSLAEANVISSQNRLDKLLPSLKEKSERVNNLQWAFNSVQFFNIPQNLIELLNKDLRAERKILQSLTNDTRETKATLEHRKAVLAKETEKGQQNQIVKGNAIDVDMVVDCNDDNDGDNGQDNDDEDNDDDNDEDEQQDGQRTPIPEPQTPSPPLQRR